MFIRAISNYQKIMKYPCMCPWIWWTRFNLLIANNVTLSVSSLSILFTFHPIPKVTKQLSPWRDNVKMREKSFFFRIYLHLRNHLFSSTSAVMWNLFEKRKKSKWENLVLFYKILNSLSFCNFDQWSGTCK